MKALVLGADSPIGLAVIRELGRHDVLVHAIGRDRHAIGGASRYTHSLHSRPSGPLGSWLPELIEATKAHCLLAISESDLVALASLPPVIAGCIIATPRNDVLSIVLDKRETLSRAQALGIDVPPGWQPDGGTAPDLQFPVVLKWPDPTAIAPVLELYGIEFKKAEYALDRAALSQALKQYDAIGQWPLVQAYAHGVGLGQMLYMHEGRATLRFQHRRLHEWPPEGGVSTLCQAVPLTEHVAQMERSEALLAAINWQGAAMVEYRYDVAADRYTLMEINGRFWGSLPLASACHAEFAWETYRQTVIGDTARPPTPRSDLTARYAIPEARRLLRLWLSRDQIADPLFKAKPVHDTADYFLRSFDPRTRHYVFSWSDPGPFFRDAVNVTRKALRRGSRQ